jgi:nitrate reductase NapE component
VFANILSALSILVGFLLIFAALNDVFQSVVVPRAVGRRFRISFVTWRSIWRLWPTLAWTFYRDEGMREDFLALFAPFTLVLLLTIWAVTLVIGYGFVFWGLRGGFTPPLHTLGQAIYFSGTSVLTIGFGDIVGRTAAPRFFSIAAALSGFSVLSITTAYLFSLFGAFQNRETFVVTVGARAGSPPSGVNLLTIAKYSDSTDDLPRLMIEAQRWIATVMESHLAYPVLAFFRSSHDYESWIGTMGTLLDAATLLMTTIEGPRNGQARLTYNIGRHATYDLAHYFRLQSGEESAGIGRDEFDKACDRLGNCGYTLHDRDEAWNRFSQLRGAYAGHLNSMARFFEIPPLQWVGDRSPIKVPSLPHA